MKNADLNYNCPGKKAIEISGEIAVSKELSWATAIIPDMFIPDLNTVKQENTNDISELVKKFNFVDKYKILKITNPESNHVDAVYDTDIGRILMRKNFYNIGQITSCAPASSINIMINDLPGSFNYVKAENDTSKCMWNLQVLDINHDSSYYFSLPFSCTNELNKPSALKIISTFKELIPITKQTPR